MTWSGIPYSREMIYSQIVELIHPQQFRRCVDRYLVYLVLLY